LRQLFAGGGSVTDPSSSYGAAERIVGELLSSLNARDKVFIATKISTRGDRDDGIQSMQESGVQLKMNYFELMQVHNL
jgi:aryl-alcohol dehydrogenase-like predicted oxidoreductase